MRNPQRIEKAMLSLKHLWKRHPELRLGQLIGNIIKEESLLYYIEDEELLKVLWKGYGEIKK